MEIAENRFAVEVEDFECSVHVLIVHFETGFLKGKFNVIAVPEVGADDLHTGGGDGATLKVSRRAGEGVVVGAVTPVPGLLIIAVGDDELAAAVGHLMHHERVIAVAGDGDVTLLPRGDIFGFDSRDLYREAGVGDAHRLLPQKLLQVSGSHLNPVIGTDVEDSSPTRLHVPLPPCLVVLALGLAVEDGFQLAAFLEDDLAVEGLTRLGLAALERDGLPGEKGRCLPLGELLPAEGEELEAAPGDLLPRPIFLLFIPVGGAAIDAPGFHHVLPALGALADGRPVPADASADVGRVPVPEEHTDDVLLQGVHARLAVRDVLLDEPPAGGHVRTGDFRREQVVEGAGLLGGADLALGFLKVPARFQVLDDGGARRRRADAAVLALLAVVLALEDFPDLRVLHVLGDGGHVGDEGALGVGLGRRGLLLGDPALDMGEVVPTGLNPRVAGRLFVLLGGCLAEGRREPGLAEALAHGGHGAPIDVEGAGAHVVDGGREELHGVALHDGRVDLGLVRRHPRHRSIRLLRDDAVMGGDVAFVERLGVDGEVQRPRDAEVPHGLPEDVGGLREVLLLEVLGVASVVGDGLVLVAEVLRYLLGLGGGVAVALAHVGEQDGEVVRERRVLDALGDLGGEVTGGAVEGRLERVQRLALEDVLLAAQQLLTRLELERHRGRHRVRIRAKTLRLQLVIPARDVVLDGLVAVHDQPEGRGLHATDREQPAEPLGGETGLVHAEAGVGHLPRVGGVTGAAALPVWLEALERLDDVLLDVVVDVDAQHLAVVAEVVQQLVHDELPLVVRVARVDDAIGVVQQVADAPDEVFLALGRLLRPVRDVDGQGVQRPRLSPPRVNLVRFHQLQEVTGASDDHVPVARDGQRRALGHALAAHGAGDVPCQHRLLRDDQLVSHVSAPFLARRACGIRQMEPLDGRPEPERLID